MAIPIEATIIMVLKEMALDPMAEFKKFTASLLTPTTKSAIANTASAANIKIYKLSIIYFKRVKCTLNFGYLRLS